MEENLIAVLDCIVWYNDLYKPLLEIKKMILKNSEFEYNHLLRPEGEDFKDDQFEIFWMMLVLQFGDYGTSPRSGWLEMNNKDKIINFIDSITDSSLPHPGILEENDINE